MFTNLHRKPKSDHVAHKTPKPTYTGMPTDHAKQPVCAPTVHAANENFGPHYTPSEDIRDAERYRAVRTAFTKEHTDHPPEQFDLAADTLVASRDKTDCSCGEPDAPNTEHLAHAPCYTV